ncbi:MAG: histone deacetylase family protein [Rhizobiales bacterium]|nr:histone deacetylase family protein [Hyphomicrobiales bacterium]
MRTIFSEKQRAHAPASYSVNGTRVPIPETPARLSALLSGTGLSPADVEAPAGPVERDLLLSVHSERYLDFLSTAWGGWQRLEPRAPEIVPNLHAIGRASLVETGYPASLVGRCGYHMGDGSCPIVAGTHESALASAATAAHAARLVAAGERHVYALCRPPGHHASADLAAGFCYLNNTAIAAEFLTRAGRRTAILDIDVHHGNGTEAIFYERADVLTVSLHADPSRFYPFFWGYAEARGRGAGEGANLNIPLPRGTGDADYLIALEGALARIADHRPDVLVLAAGLDIAADDPLAGFAITRPGIAAIGRAIAGLGLPMVVVQEGGYAIESLGASLAALLEGLTA